MPKVLKKYLQYDITNKEKNRSVEVNMKVLIATKNQGKIEGDIIDTDLSQVMNKIFIKDDERHNKGGGIQLLTHDVISRVDLTETAFIMALTKYINEDKWK